MSYVTLGGKRHGILDDIPAPGIQGEDFTFVKDDLSEGTLYDDFPGKVQVLIGVPSLDTGVCQAETRKFNEELSKRDGVIGLVVSRDLPFAMKRFCEADGIEYIVPASG